MFLKNTVLLKDEMANQELEGNINNILYLTNRHTHKEPRLYRKGKAEEGKGGTCFNIFIETPAA